MIDSLILKNRSYRRFNESSRITVDQLLKLVDLARLSPSSRNQQALKFMLIHKEEDCYNLFKELAWAGYLKDWKGPVEGERPAAYIIILGDTELGKQFDTDVGIAAQSILIGAVALGFGGCMIGSIKKEQVKETFSIGDSLPIQLVIALGEPIELVKIEVCIDKDIRYWRDEQHIHHVPKRSLDEIILTF